MHFPLCNHARSLCNAVIYGHTFSLFHLLSQPHIQFDAIVFTWRIILWSARTNNPVNGQPDEDNRRQQKTEHSNTFFTHFLCRKLKLLRSIKINYVQYVNRVK